jgi:hypothetical protein
MTAAKRWSDNWLVVSPTGAVRVDIPRGNKRATLARVGRLPKGTPIVLVAAAPGAARRCRAFAAATDVKLEREYLTFPSPGAPAYLVEDASAAVHFFSQKVLAVPPGIRMAASVEAALKVVRVLSRRGLLGMLAPGRVAIGRRA